MNKTLGQIAYEGYCETTGWKSLVSGAVLPQWEDVNNSIKEAWEAAAKAVQREILAKRVDATP